MKHKFSSMGRVAIALVLALSLSLVMAVPAGATNQDEALPYVAKGDINVLMLQFDVENTNADFPRNFTGVRVSFSGNDLADVDTMRVFESDGTTEVETGITFDSSPVSFAFTAIPLDPGATETYYIAIDIAAGAIDQHLVSIALEAIDGDEEVGATATLPFSSGSTVIDANAPAFDSAITGDSADGNSTALDNIYLSFTEAVSGLNSDTVATNDFDVESNTVVDIVEVGDDYIILELGSDLLTYATPSVTLNNTAGGISDLAGNNLAGPVTIDAADGLKPTVVSVAWGVDDATKDTLTLTFSENIALPGVKADYSVDYDGRDVNVISVDGEPLNDDVILNIEDQSLQVDFTDVGEFTVTLDNPGNVKDTSGNSVDPANNFASVDVDDFGAVTNIVSAVTMTITTIDVTFSQDLDGTTVDKSGFTVDGNTVDSATETSPGVVTLTLETEIATDATPKVDYDGSGTLEDIAGIEVVNCTDTTPDDGIAPTMDSAVTLDTTTIDVIFSEDLGDATVAKTDFTVVDNTVTGISEASGVVTLTLGTEIATDATPDVTYTAGSLKDDATVGNAAVTTTVTPTDGAGPVLNSVSWIDVNGDDAVNAMDTLTFTFSEAMLRSTITASNVDDALLITNGGGTYGSGAVVSWAADDTVVVTLAIGETVDIGHMVNPADAVHDVPGNLDATSVDVRIQDLTDPVLLNGVPYPTIQDAINDASEGDTINVAPGEYVGAVVNKGVKIIGAAGGASVIISGVPYKVNGPTPETGFRLDAGADGAEIRNFTMNGEFLFGVFARNADSVIVDSLALNDMVQGITNWGGSNWEITNNVITETYPTTGGGIAIQLGADPVDFPHCDNNLVQGNIISTSAVQSASFTGAAICLWFDERNDGGYVPPTIESMTGNEIIGNSITATGLENQVGIEIGVGGLDGDETKVAACLGVIHGNTVTNNTIDNAEWGLNLYVTTDLTVSGNTIKNCSDCGIYMKDDHANCLINNNNIYGNTNYGLNNTDGATYSTTVNATNNWWGDVSGPTHSTNSGGIGDAVSDNVDYSLWLSAAYPDGVACVAVTLEAGWNLISLPLIPTNSDIETVLAGITDGPVEQVQAYNTDIEDFDQWASSGPMFENPTLTLMAGGVGFWLEMESDGTLVATGYELCEPAPAMPPEYPVVDGWNLIGYKFTVPGDIAVYLGGVIHADLQAIYGYDATTGYFIPDPEEDGLEPGHGYWIALTKEGTIYPTWAVPVEPEP